MPALDSFGLTPSLYGAENQMLALADSFLTPGQYSTLRSGMWGYVTGVLARATAEGAYHRNVLYKEQFLNTASLPQSIYAFAKIYNIVPGLATPSQATVLLGLYVSDIQAAIGASTGTFVLPRGLQVYLGSVPFVIAGEVDLTLGGVDTTGQVIVSAQYNLAQMDFPDPTLPYYVSTYTIEQPTGTSGTVETVVYMKVRIRQAQSTTTDFTIVRTSALSSLFYQVAYSGELAGFTTYIQGPADAAPGAIPAIFNESEPGTGQYCYYDYYDDQTLEVYFSPLLGEFQPSYNTKLRIVAFTCLGAAGNFDFSGTVSCALPAPYANVPVLTQLLTQPTGGADQQTILALKQQIQQKVLQRNGIVIESDLEAYLSQVVQEYEVNNSQITFVKERDDLLARTFNAFLTMFDSSGRVIPTNSVTLNLEIADLDANGWSLKPGTIVIYDRVNQIFRLTQYGEFPNQMVGDPNNFVYAVPYLMAFFAAPFPRLTYFQNMIDEEASVYQGPGDVTVADSFTAGSMTVSRNAVTDNTYQIEIALNTSLPTAQAVAQSVIMRLRVLGTDGTDYGYAPMSVVTGTEVFRAAIATQDQFDPFSNMIFPNTLYDANDNVIPAQSVPQEINLVAELYYYNGTVPTSGAVRSILQDGQYFQLVTTWTTSSPLSFYQSLEGVLFSDMYVTTAGTFVCNQVPLVGAQYFLNPRLGQGALGVAAEYQGQINSAFSLLANNTGVNVKFSNTYGPSVYYTVDRVNISVQLEVCPSAGPSAALESAIVAAVASFVAGTNNNAQGRFSVSNLITSLETNIPGIEFIRFVGVNGLATQSTQRTITDQALELVNNRVPEFLSVSTILTSNLSSDPYVPDVSIKFVTS